MDPTSLLAGFGVIALCYLLLRFLGDGIGLGFTQELALNNFNVVLHGRNPTKLEGVKSRLNRDFPNVRFRILVADATSPSTAQFEDIVASLSDLDLTILINNAGGGSVDRVLLPLLTRQSGPSLIMNIGSLGTAGGPYAVPYSGAKAFLMSMSKSLDVELRTENKNVEVLAVPIGKVTNTGLNSKDPVSFFTPDGRTMARAALGRVGCGKDEVVGYVGHAMQQFVFDLLPNWAKESVMVPVMKGINDDYSRKSKTS